MVLPSQDCSDFQKPRAVALAASQSGFAPENFTTLPHFSVSSATYLPKSDGELMINVAPISANFVLTAGSARIAFTVLLSFSMISGGVPRGTPNPYQALAS